MTEIKASIDKSNGTPEYGPTQTGDWLNCPTLRQFNRTWTQRGPYTPHMDLGTAFSDALAIYLKAPGESGMASALEAARHTLESSFDDSSEWSLEGLFELLKKGMAEAASTTLKEMLKNEAVLDTEITIGRARLDLVTQDKVTGALIVTDHKSKLKQDPKYMEQFLDETLHDLQLKDYSVRAAQYYNEHVAERRRHVIVLTP